MSEDLTPEEEERLARRAAAIWGENPFSPEAMAQDAQLKGPERAHTVTKRHRRMADLEEEY